MLRVYQKMVTPLPRRGWCVVLQWCRHGFDAWLPILSVDVRGHAFRADVRKASGGIYMDTLSDHGHGDDHDDHDDDDDDVDDDDNKH